MSPAQLLFLSLFVVSAHLSIQSQSTLLKVEGKVLDSLAAVPLELATVSALNTEGTFIVGTTTDKTGHYQLELAAGEYQLRFAFVGYQNYSTSLSLASSVSSIPTVHLVPYGIDLAEIAVVGERSRVEHRIDRKLIHIGKDLQSIGDASEVLGQIAEVQVDQNGQLQLRGSSQVVLLVNGKPSPLSNSDLLQQISSSDISRIELISTPSVKYQADGLSGMINIITQQKVQRGFQSNLNTSASSNEQYQANFRMAYGTSTIGLHAQAGWSDRLTDTEKSRSRISPELNYEEQSATQFSGGVKRINIGLDYLPGDRHQFSGQMQFVDNSHEIISRSDVTEYRSAGTDNFLFRAINNHSHLSAEQNFNYRYSWPAAEHYIEVEWHCSKNTNDLKANYQLENTSTTQALDYRNRIDNIALDYAQKLPAWDAHLESGVLITLKEAQNELVGQQFDGSTPDEPFIYDEQIWAAYGLVRKAWQKWQLQMGLRYEAYRANISFGQDFQNDFNNLFPSFHLSYSSSEKVRLTLAYNRRTSRPSLWNLNPFSNPSNRYYQHQGNPDLQPEFSHNAELSAQISGEKGSISPTLFLRHKTNLINMVYDLEQTQAIQTFVNDGQSLAYGLELSSRRQLSGSWSIQASANAYWEQLSGAIFLSSNRKVFSGNARLKNEVKVSKQWAIEFEWRYFAPGQRRFSTYRSRQKWDLALRWKFWKNRANLSARLTDVFDTFNYQGSLLADDFQEVFWNKRETRVAYLAFSYTFRKGSNGPKRSRKKRNFREEGTLE